MATINGTAAGETLTGTEDADTIGGLGGNDILYGQGGNDRIDGGAGADQLYGGAGDDVLLSGLEDQRSGYIPQDDLLDGGEGNDTADYSDAFGFFGNSIVVDLEAGTASSDVRYAQVERIGADRFVSIENVLGGSGRNTLRGSPVGNLLVGGGGADLLDGRGGEDVLLGGLGDDVLMGGAGGDVLQGAAGGDYLFGGDDSDFLFGGDGNDSLQGGRGSNRLDGGAGFDVADYSATRSPLWIDLALGYHADPEAYDLFVALEGAVGGSGNDHMFGTARGDVLNGGAGDDVLSGRDGNDVLTGGAGANDLRGGDGVDLVDFGARTQPLYVDLSAGYFSSSDEYDRFTGIEGIMGGQAGDLLIGTSGFDVLLGQAGNDTLRGGGGNDFLFGGDGDDVLISGAGNDNMYGQDGADRFDVSAGGWDTIHDLNSRGGDRIYLGGGRRFTQKVEGDFTGDGITDVQLTYDGGTVVLSNNFGGTLGDYNAIIIG